MIFGVFIATLIIVPIASILIWLFLIRPYCRHNGEGYTPGANVGVTFWIDWQHAKEIATSNGDQKMVEICKLLMALQIGWVVLLIIAFIQLY